MSTSQRRAATSVPAPVQVLSILLFAGFAISTSVVAIDQFWPAGIALAGFLALQWGRIPTLSGGQLARDVDSVKPGVPETEEAPSGNAAFDAYRAELMTRLEQERTNFEGFLTRLRAAKDKAEFEDFMEDRARLARAATGQTADMPARRPAPTPDLRETA